MKILRSRICLLSFILSTLFLFILLFGTRIFWQDVVPLPAADSPASASEEPAESPTPEPQYVTFGL